MRPHRRLRGLAFGFASYTLLAGVFALHKMAVFSARGEAAGPNAILLTFLGIYTWAALTPIVFWTSRRFPLGRTRSAKNLLVHFAVMSVLIVVDLAVYASLDQFLVPGYRWPGDARPFLERFQLLLAWGAAGEVLWYAGVAALSHALDYRDVSRTRELEAARVEGRLARARVQLLKSQLQPHFLFNTLNAISALVREEPHSARRMLARLGDLLRLTLDHDGREKVTLSEELEMLEAYLEIQVARFPDRLVVDWDVAPDATGARVPNMLLQPLVENAVRHGIARREGDGRIQVRARRRDGRLLLRVRDNGGGLPAGTRSLKEGIGLANTRARLRELYGPDHAIELANAEGGLSVTLDLPFTTRASPGPRQVLEPPPALPDEAPERFTRLPRHPAVWAAIPLAWLFLLVGQYLFLIGPTGEPLEPTRLLFLGWQGLAWTSFTAGILLVCARFPLGGGQPRANFAVHVAANALLLCVGVSLIALLDPILGWVMWQEPAPTSFRGRVLRAGLGGFIDYVIRYWLVVGVAHAVAFRRLASERELRASQLEARLHRTELQLLTVQMQPRFLFDTLQGISAEVERDPRTAERMLARLSDLLRLVLEHDEREEVSLQEELSFLDPYLTIQEARFGGRLAVRRRVEPDALDARVPGLILQPLVDHAVRRVLAGPRGRGAVEIRAQRRGGNLELEVRGDAPPGAVTGNGGRVALETTRLRLRRLYGADHRLAVHEDPGGSLHLELAIPYVPASAEDQDEEGPPVFARARGSARIRSRLSRSRGAEV